MDKLLRLARDSETTQAIDRLRSVRSSLDDNKTVWILCNIPVDIRVENLMRIMFYTYHKTDRIPVLLFSESFKYLRIICKCVC